MCRERCESISSWNLTGNVLRETKKIVTSYLVVDRKNSICFKKCCIQCTFLDLGGDAGRTRVLSGEILKLTLKRTYHFSFFVERICRCSFIVLNYSSWRGTEQDIDDHRIDFLFSPSG